MTTTDATTPLGESFLDNLAVLGRRDHLDQPGIALCGSRAAGEQGIAFAKAVGELAAAQDLSLVSGYAKGVDLAGHVACVEAGGHTIAVLAEGLGRFRLRRELRTVIDPWDEVESRLTAVSEFEHTARWTVWRAMRRNALICSLGQVLVAIDPGDRGGTLDAVNKAIKQEMPVVIGWSDPEQNHNHLVGPLSSRHVSLVTNLDDLLNAVEAAILSNETRPLVSQPTLL